MGSKPRVVQSILPSFVSATLVVVLPTAWSLLFARGSYAGVQDEGVSSSASAHYGSYLSEVAASMFVVAATEIVLFFATLLGLSFLWRFQTRGPFGPKKTWFLHVLAAIVVATTWFLYVADRHPGLFLSTLSHSALAYPMLAVARFFAPAIAALSLLGYAIATLRGTRGLGIGIGVAVAVVVSLLVARRSVMRAHEHTPYRTAIDPKAPPKPPQTPAAKAARRTAASAPSVLWISVDSLRPDKIDPAHTPNLARLVGESIYFPNTLVVVPRTGPSWSASLTSMSPLTNGVETMFPDSRSARLSNFGMPAHLVSRGFRAGVFSDYAGEFFGKVELGFQIKSVPEVELREITGQVLIGNAPLVLAQAGMIYSLGTWERDIMRDPLNTLLRGLTSFTQPQVLSDDLYAWLEENKTAPFFSLVFYSQPHFPYASNGPYYRKYHASGSSSSIAFGRDVTNETPITSKEDIAQIDALYRGALAESDAALGKLLSKLEASGHMDDTIVVITADHGEGLYECATCVGHGDNLRGMFTLRTPLAFRLPRARYPKGGPQVVETYVSQLDIYPTILSLLGEPPVAIHEGIALLSKEGLLGVPPAGRILFAETGEWLWTTPAVPKDRLEYPPITGMATLDRGRIAIDRKYLPVIRAAKHRAAIRWPYKLVYEPRKGSVDHRLYKCDEDPLDERDLSQKEPDIARELKDALRLDVLRHSNMMSVRDWFVSRPDPPEEE